MAESIKYCRKCGASISPESLFCRECGTKVMAAPVQEPIRIVPGKRICIKCGQEAADGAMFCRKCGYRFGQGAAPGRYVAPVAKPAGQQIPRAVMPAFKDGISAAAQAGEFEVMSFVSEAMSAVSDAAESIVNVKEVIGPISAIGSGVKSFLGGILGIFKSPKNIIMTLAMAGLWIFLGMNRGSDEELIQALSFLTFAEGGFDRDTLGMVGGIAGKGVVGFVLASVFKGGIGKLAGGLGSVFGKTQTKRSILFMLFGMLLGMVLYIIFTGEYASGATAMAGISGAVLALEALGSKDGNIYQIAESITSRKKNGVRMAQDGRTNSLLVGMTFGFALITALSAMI